MRMESLSELIIDRDDLAFIFGYAGPVIDIIIEDSYLKDLFEYMQKSAFTCTVRSDKHIDVILILSMEFDALKLMEVWLIRITQKVGDLDSG